MPKKADDNDVEAQLIEVLKTQASEFVKGNTNDGLSLGADVARSILTQEIALAAIQTLPADASLDDRAALEECLEARTRALQFVSTADRAIAEELQRIRANAVAVATKIGVAGGTILAGAAVKALLASK